MIRSGDLPTQGGFTLIRWFISIGTFGIPQAAAPIIFSLIALKLTGDAERGAAIVLAMTVAQVLAAVPIVRLGARYNAVSYLRILVVIRTIALCGMVVVAQLGWSFWWLLVPATIAGSVNGAAYGYLRSILNHFVHRAQLPRAIAIGATLSEVSFVAIPVAASLLGAPAPFLALLIFALLGAIPAFMLPPLSEPGMPNSQPGRARLLTPPIMLWLFCAACMSSVVATIEIGSVTLAMNFGYDPALGFLFTVALCVSSVLSGVWVSVRNKVQQPWTIILLLAALTLGSAAVAFGISVLATIAGAIVIGVMLPQLGTHYSLMLDDLAPLHRRADVLALLRSAGAIGTIGSSALLTFSGFEITAVANAVAMLIATLTVIGVQLFAPLQKRPTCDQSP